MLSFCDSRFGLTCSDIEMGYERCYLNSDGDFISPSSMLLISFKHES
ncbi:hypothetical protein MNBD_GAMMA12-1033 [hydrothermal vent metagenome]|uniref:Uncharacterized protein n=1 Tax=hydrothermal vent metagenome TaxID=652676 RepID=A0A3B0YMQ7_9ZZZZ